MNYREQYRRFRAWQKRPRRYSNKKLENHSCNNCGHKFAGNYCPVCGQKASWGRITWDAVRENVMLLWGMESHSMPYTLFQLMLRPGYLIGEYISGKRQVSYPPVKMLCVVAVVFAMIKQLTGFNSLGSDMDLERVKAKSTLLHTFFLWMLGNYGWVMLILTSLFSIPTWIIFRFAPRNPRHTFPESVFIQIFMSSLLLICILLSKISSVFTLLIPFYYYLTYRQLFGYRFWGTMWRLISCFLIWVLALFFILVVALMYFKPEILEGESLGENLLEILLAFILPFVILLSFGYLIGKWTEKRRTKRVERQSQSNEESPKMVK